MKQRPVVGSLHQTANLQQRLHCSNLIIDMHHADKYSIPAHRSGNTGGLNHS
ncbi:hypothetical protein D3C73_1641530 [compost metagenome]